MSVVKSNKAFTFRTMERERIIQPVRLSLVSGYAPHDEPNPVPAFGIDHNHLPIKIEQGVERCVTRHLLSLSQTDKRL
jgi:hypothetical protein